MGSYTIAQGALNVEASYCVRFELIRKEVKILTNFVPGVRGFRVQMNATITQWLSGALSDIDYAVVYRPTEVLEALVADSAWGEMTDEYGRKAYLELTVDDISKVRVTVMEQEGGHYAVDIRQWWKNDRRNRSKDVDVPT